VKRELAADASGAGGEHDELQAALREVIDESDRVLASALPQSLLHAHARRLRDAASRTLALLPRP